MRCFTIEQTFEIERGHTATTIALIIARQQLAKAPVLQSMFLAVRNGTGGSTSVKTLVAYGQCRDSRRLERFLGEPRFRGTDLLNFCVGVTNRPLTCGPAVQDIVFLT